MRTRTTTSRKGFTLIELLTVIAIIGILASILIPTINSVITNAKKVTASNNARQIAQTYQSYSNAGSNPRSIATQQQAQGGTRVNGVAQSINDVAFILAAKAQLNDASLWFVKSDPELTNASIPRAVVEGDLNTAQDVSASFKAVTPKSWAFVTGLPTTAAATTTPLLWTYGLDNTGIWKKASPWLGQGGHIAYLDGHVEWADKLSTEVNGSSFIVYASNPNSGTPTADFNKAIPNSGTKNAVVVNQDGQDK